MRLRQTIAVHRGFKWDVPYDLRSCLARITDIYLFPFVEYPELCLYTLLLPFFIVWQWVQQALRQCQRRGREAGGEADLKAVGLGGEIYQDFTSGESKLVIRNATLDDLEDGGVVLARAFQEDPWSVSVYPDPVGRFLLQKLQCVELLAYCVEEGEPAYILEKDGVVTAVAIGGKPFGYDYFGRVSEFANYVSHLGVAYMREAILTIDSVDAMHRKQRLWGGEVLQDVLVLKMFGVEPSCTGQGLGSLLLHSFLENEVSKCGLYAYLESSAAVNVPLYKKFGFQQVEVWEWFPGTEPLFLMLRSPSKPLPDRRYALKVTQRPADRARDEKPDQLLRQR